MASRAVGSISAGQKVTGSSATGAAPPATPWATRAAAPAAEFGQPLQPEGNPIAQHRPPLADPKGCCNPAAKAAGGRGPCWAMIVVKLET
jgi:hypothetical protein